MISHLRGKLTHKTSTEAVVECAGVGYSANISIRTSENLPIVGKEVFLLTELITREDSMQLYGFSDTNEKKAFLILTSVSGIGPKIALGILSSVSAHELQEYIASKNTAALRKLPGIGKKTADRLVFELHDKIIGIAPVDVNEKSSGSAIKQEAIAALITLGFSQVQADKAVAKAISNEKDESIEVIIKEALNIAKK